MDDIIKIAEIEICGHTYPLTLTFGKLINMLLKDASKGAKLVIITHLINALQGEDNDIVTMELRKIKEMIR